MRYVLTGLLIAVAALGAVPPESWQKRARALFQQLIEINTQDSNGNVTAAAEAMAAHFRAAGFPAQDVVIAGNVARRKNLVVRYRGTGRARPVLLLAHLDVVEARRSDWSTFDPFKFTESEGQFYGRGTSDDKSMAAIWVATLLRYQAEGYRPERDLILALTAGEESGVDNGVEWLVRNRRDLIDAEFCINEGGDAVMRQGRKVFLGVQAAEKTFLTFDVIAKNAGGHSSLPSKDNAIYHLADALGKIRSLDFPARLTDVTQGFFEKMSVIDKRPEAADMALVSRTPPDPAAVERMSKVPFFNAQLRTTCVATMITGGHAENALPQSVSATVNCRMLPGDTAGNVQGTLERAINDPEVTVKVRTSALSAPVAKLQEAVMGPVRMTVEELFPGVPVVPTMSTGATDGKYLRNAGIPTYGVDGLFFEEGENRAHGRDERVPVQSFYESQEFLYRLVKRLAAAK